jgi:hypothetical protein
LKLRQLGDEKENRLGLVVRQIQESINKRRQIFADEPAAQLKLDAEEAETRTFARRSGVGRYPNFLSVKAASGRYGRTPDLGFYDLSHHFVHGTDFAMNFSRQRLNTEHVLVHDRTKTLWVQVGVAIFASLSLVDATKGAAEVFGWHGVQALADLQDEFDAIQVAVKPP